MPSSPNDYGGFSQRKSPWSTNEERLVTEAFERNTQPREIVALTEPPLPQIMVWRPRMGYGDPTQRQPTIETVLLTERYIPDRRLDFSGSAGQYSSTTRPSTGANPY